MAGIYIFGYRDFRLQIRVEISSAALLFDNLMQRQFKFRQVQVVRLIVRRDETIGGLALPDQFGRNAVPLRDNDARQNARGNVNA